ncbi:PIN domain-containing protein [Streptomyces mirabilis]|uniref:PIN domain-containing protein n=1 Tax=Streptomyces mirabilis TaxID=68239 RepID=UPI0036E2AF00
MIILDSNILKGISLRGPEAELLRALRASGVERVAAPWIVLEELAAQEALRYAEKHAAALDAMNTLRKATPWESVRIPRKADPERVRRHWRSRYAELAETLPTSQSAYQQALFREANLLAPCKTVNSGKHKTGARDAAIWLTAVEYTREHPEETVYFVSNNTADFGDGGSFKHPLDEDLEDVQDRFILFTSLDGVVTRFATQVAAPEKEVREALAADSSHAVIAPAAMRQHRWVRGSTASVVERSSRRLMNRHFARWLGAPAVCLSSVTDIRAHEIAGHMWCTATARWLLAGHDVLGSSRDNPLLYCAWETRVLLSTTAPENGVTVLGGGPFTAIAPEDIDHLPPGDNSEALIDELTRFGRRFANRDRDELLARLLSNLHDANTPAEEDDRLVDASRATAALWALQDRLRSSPASGEAHDFTPESEDD